MTAPAIQELERQIDATRHGLERTLGTLKLELSPRHQLERAWRATRDRTGRSLRAGADLASENPVPVVLASALLVAAVYLGATRFRPRR